MNRTVVFAVLLLLIPGCLEDVELAGVEASDIDFDTDSVYSNVTFNIYVGESLECDSELFDNHSNKSHCCAVARR